ncbi:MAG: hypothetical protein LLG00_13940 [Planctomycetaceae bacterium]|nr:hypothetical protein [Planctomycetaceae bacterium]
MCSKYRQTLFLCLCVGAISALRAPAALAADQVAPNGQASIQDARLAITWHKDYALAMAEADRRNAMLLIYFCDGEQAEPSRNFREETLRDPQVTSKLREYVCVKLPLTAKIKMHGKDVVLLEQEAFSEMHGSPGIAIVDFRARKEPLRGAIVSMFPITETLCYTPEQMTVILTLPSGTLTQRTLVYAVRTHPEKPASADGDLSAELSEEAESHSQYQADIRLLGHHAWESRFQRIISRLPGGFGAREVCAQSWPGEHLVEAAIECVRSWRSSSGHWDAVRSSHTYSGYDMKRGDDGVWYATGIFGG